MSDEIKFDAILHMDDPQFPEKLAAAIGLAPGDVVNVTTPQFERTDGLRPIENPSELFHSLHTLPKETLLKLGMQPWGDYGLWLFPYQWYKHIPAGFKILDICGKEEEFAPGETDDDMRFGALSYGIVPEFERKEFNAE